MQLPLYLKTILIFQGNFFLDHVNSQNTRLSNWINCNRFLFQINDEPPEGEGEDEEVEAEGEEEEEEEEGEEKEENQGFYFLFFNFLV